MKAILDFLKWLFGEIFKLSAAKMLMFLLFLSLLAFMGYKIWLEKEEITIKTAKPIEKVNE